MPAPEVQEKLSSLRYRGVIITGGGRGLGLEIARAPARAGCRIAISCARDSGDLRAAQGELAAIAGPAKVLARQALPTIM